MVGRIVGTEECYKNVNIWSSTKKETNWEKEIKVCRSRCGHFHSCIFLFTLPGNNCRTISGWQILPDSSCTAAERITSKLRGLTQQAFMISVWGSGIWKLPELGGFWLEISPEVGDKELAAAAGSDGLARAGGPSSKLMPVVIGRSLSSSPATGQSNSSLPPGPLQGLLVYLRTRQMASPSTSRQTVSAPDRQRTKETPLCLRSQTQKLHPSVPPQSVTQKWVTKDSLHSRGGKLGSTFWREEYRIVCGHLFKQPHPLTHFLPLPQLFLKPLPMYYTSWTSINHNHI